MALKIKDLPYPVTIPEQITRVTCYDSMGQKIEKDHEGHNDFQGIQSPRMISRQLPKHVHSFEIQTITRKTTFVAKKGSTVTEDPAPPPSRKYEPKNPKETFDE